MRSDGSLSSRRRLLRLGVAAGGGLAAGRLRAGDARPAALGSPVSGYSERSRYVKSARLFRTGKNAEAASSLTPLQDSYGILTPSALHYERHHAGIPDIDPAAHRLIIHGLVERPLILTMEDIRKLPSVSRLHFIECGGNSGSEWSARTAPDVQRSHGLASCSEWTGAPLALLLAETGLRRGASWVIAEGGDACRMQRSIPLAKARHDIILAYAQNGEPLRPAQGFPLRLVVPGWEGAVHVKWLQRLKLTGQPYMSRDETSRYTDLMPDGTARQFTFVMEAKSVITFPSGGQRLQRPGWYEITGLAWSGRGTVERVEISTDGGRGWRDAKLQEPRLRMAFTRFRLAWKWEGGEAALASRATDETGYVQPTREALVAVRGLHSGFHNNAIKWWKVSPDGGVANA